MYAKDGNLHVQSNDKGTSSGADKSWIGDFGFFVKSKMYADQCHLHAKEKPSDAVEVLPHLVAPHCGLTDWTGQ